MSLRDFQRALTSLTLDVGFANAVYAGGIDALAAYELSPLEARRLERDFGVGLDAAALILDLEHEVRRLKGVLRAQGLGREI